ncbi:MAG: helix-turn-helix domain-containing protein [Candidatus Marinimicrobia bacterium]|nr:helix-turn-helix domain-containing protein [Candidatus Neomarinimicrobiota bacterium]MCF7829639.1 helix-turn-helix domain-containing protein [Candidatus Neomarinimicrobiota bacterium]MCF7879799.1 helix-turn-helix domain-containing protein [Candidatus Neomarinimicrobiota bacterium]
MAGLTITGCRIGTPAAEGIIIYEGIHDHQQLAYKKGISRESVSRILNEWKKNRNLREDGKTFIIDDYEQFLTKVI